MVATGDHDQGLVIDAVNQAVSVVDAARPKAREVFLEGFGLANALERVTQAVLEQGVDALEGLLILPLPVFVIVPGGQGRVQVSFSSVSSIGINQILLLNLSLAVLLDGACQVGSVRR